MLLFYRSVRVGTTKQFIAKTSDSPTESLISLVDVEYKNSIIDENISCDESLGSSERRRI